MNKKPFYISLILTLSLYFLEVQAQVVSIKTASFLTDKDWKKLPEHPRLFANDVRIASLKQQKDDVSKQLLALLKTDADKKLVAEKIVYPNAINTFGTGRNVQGRILSLALSYRIFGDTQYLEKAKAELLQLVALSNWGTGHFLDVGEACLAAGVAFDWLHDEFTASEKELIINAIVNKALLPSLEAKEAENNKSWVNGNFNWNPVCHAGLTIAALSIAEYKPKLARQIVERGLKNIPYAGAEYAPDGSYPEGPSYWSYGTSFYVFEIEALRSVFGKSFGIDKMEGFLKTADYNNQMVGTTGEDFNYSDYHIENLNEPIMLWFGRELNRYDLVKDELKDLSNLYQSTVNGIEIATGKKVIPNRHFPLEILWWKPSLKQKINNTKAPLHWTAKGGLPIAVMRSGWDDVNASFIAIKGGTPNNSHGHMDVGSFVLEADGVRWALDLGTENYDKMRAAKLDLWDYSQNSNRWTTFRCGPEGHNILRFNNARQDISGFGVLKPTKQVTNTNELDLSTLYASQVEKVIRKIELRSDKSMVIEDTWKTRANSVEASFQWLTKAKVIRTSYGILLEQDGKSLKLKVENKGDKMILPEIIIEDVSKTQNIQDSPNPNLTRILIKVVTNAHSIGNIQIRAYPSAVKFQ